MGLKFKVTTTKQTDNIIDDILLARGIKDLKTYKNIANSDIKLTNAFDFYNMSKGVLCLLKHLDSGHVVDILVDSDCDGYCSSAMLYQWINQYYPNLVRYIILENKSHGLSQPFNILNNSDSKLLIVPDAGSNDFNLQQRLLEHSYEDLIIIDHHDIDNEDLALQSKAIIINNQLSVNKSSNKEFTGAGMVYKFCEALNIIKEFDKPTNLLPLFVLGQIGDASDISDLELRKMIFEGFDNFKNNYLLNEFFDLNNDDCCFSAHQLSFSIIPKINAITRIGDLDSRIELFKCLANLYLLDDTLEVTRRRKNYASNKFETKKLLWNHYQLCIDNMTRIKNRQDNLVKKAVGLLNKNIINTKACVIAVINDDTLFDSAITGLVANKYINQYQKPSLVLMLNKNGVYHGSGRGNIKVMDDFRKYCLASSKFSLAQGHGNAFGVLIKLHKLEEFIDYANKFEQPNDITYIVDQLYNEYNANSTDIDAINNNLNCFGGICTEPLFGYQSLPIDRISFKNNGKVVTFKYNNINFIIFNGQIMMDMINNSGFKKIFNLDIYGTPSKSFIEEPQIIINDWSLNEDENNIENDELIF